MNGVVFMDINITKQDIAFCETVFDSVLEQSIDTEIMLPDYCGEVSRILKCLTLAQINNKKLSGNEVSIDGNCSLTVIYADNENRICSYIYDQPFKKNITVGECDSACDISVTACPDFSNCRAITPRKIDYRGTVKLSLKICKNIAKSIITDADCSYLQLKRENCPATNPLGFSQKTVVFEEDLELDRNDTLIKSVFRKCVYCVIEECKILGSKAVVKGDLIVKILYTDENDKFMTYDGKIPFNQLVDINADGDDCRCDAKIDIVSYEIKPRINISGEARSFSLDCKLLINVTASCENDISVITDIYAIDTPLDFTLSEINLKKLLSGVKEKYICTKSLDFSEKTFGTIIDMWSSAKVLNSKKIEKELSLDGTVTVCFLLKDANGEPQFFERDIDFTYTHPLSVDFDNITAECNAFAESISYTITSDAKIDVRVELAIECSLFGISRLNVLTDLEFADNKEPFKKKAPIIVYYCDAGESAWDISKKYRQNYTQFLNINAIDSDIIETPKMLLIV